MPQVLELTGHASIVPALTAHLTAGKGTGGRGQGGGEAMDWAPEAREGRCASCDRMEEDEDGQPDHEGGEDDEEDAEWADSSDGGGSEESDQVGGGAAAAGGLGGRARGAGRGVD